MSGCVNPRVGSPAATVLPSRSTVTRSVIASTSSSRCETNASAWPASRSRVMTSNRRSTSLGLSEAVGSSNTISSASSARALAISINCRWAAERCRTSVSSGARPAWPREFRMRAPAAPRGEDAPAGPVRAGRGSRARSDPARVGFPASRSPARSRARRGRMSAPGAAVEVDVTGIGAQVARDDLGKRGFARAIRAQQGMDFAGAQFEIGAVERAWSRTPCGCREGQEKAEGAMQGRACAAAVPASRRSAQISLANTVCLRVGNRVSRLARDGGDGNGDQFSGVSPSRWRSRASAACWPIR